MKSLLTGLVMILNCCLITKFVNSSDFSSANVEKLYRELEFKRYSACSRYDFLWFRLRSTTKNHSN